jgi:tetratricopeptide (TPR) repeat protein
MPTTVDTPEEITSVLAAAAGAADRGDWATATPLLEALLAATGLQGEEWTETRFRLAEGRWHAGDLPAARELFDQASVGPGPFAERAATRVLELDQQAAGAGAAADGVDAGELDDVINGAGRALMHGDHAVALELYQKAWAVAGTEPLRQGMLALGQAQCLLALARYAEAKEWFLWLQSYGDPMYAEDATGGLAEIAAHEGAVAASADGTQVPEVQAVWAEANTSYYRGDVQGALDLWMSCYANVTLTAEQRGKTVFNIAQCHVLLGDPDTARARFLEALGMGIGDPLDGYCNERLDMLDQQDAALATAGIVEL